MKKHFIQAAGLFFTSIFFCTNATAKVWRVNNNTGVNADFGQIYSAVSNPTVVAGDTIYVEPSATTYLTFITTKRLTYIGNGYLLSGANGNTGMQLNTNNSPINVQLDSAGSGSQFIGLHFVQLAINKGVDDITISRCMITSEYCMTTSTTSKILNFNLNKCYITASFEMNYFTENMQITNCILRHLNLNNTLSNNNINALVRNNTFINAQLQANNSYIANNIFLGSSSLNVSSSVIKYNIASNNILPTTGGSVGNRNSVPEASLIIGTGSDDGKYQLKNPGATEVAGETLNAITPDAGAFGTADPYRLSGIPPIPTIYALDMPASIPPAATSMQIKISTRSNN